MLKTVLSLFCTLCASFSVAFALPMDGPPSMPPRPDKLDSKSDFAKLKLQRARSILSTLVSNPDSYQLILSSRTAFGGEAVAQGFLSGKPTMILYQGALSPNRSNEEIAFMMAHELGHLDLNHMQKMDKQMEKVMTDSPFSIIGTAVAIYQQKFQEREADLYGLNLYKESGYPLTFFPETLGLLKFNPNLHFGSSRLFGKELPSLSMKDTHFSMLERFTLLTELAQA